MGVLWNRRRSKCASMAVARACWRATRCSSTWGHIRQFRAFLGLDSARPLTNIEALDLDYLPPHLIVLGGGYVGLELAQAYRRFGSEVTIIQSGPQLMVQE